MFAIIQHHLRTHWNRIEIDGVGAVENLRSLLLCPNSFIYFEKSRHNNVIDQLWNASWERKKKKHRKEYFYRPIVGVDVYIVSIWFYAVHLNTKARRGAVHLYFLSHHRLMHRIASVSYRIYFIVPFELFFIRNLFGTLNAGFVFLSYSDIFSPSLAPPFVFRAPFSLSQSFKVLTT